VHIHACIHTCTKDTYHTCTCTYTAATYIPHHMHAYMTFTSHLHTYTHALTHHILHIHACTPLCVHASYTSNATHVHACTHTTLNHACTHMPYRCCPDSNPALNSSACCQLCLLEFLSYTFPGTSYPPLSVELCVFPPQSSATQAPSPESAYFRPCLWLAFCLS
jgi:hypothetical protein